MSGKLHRRPPVHLATGNYSTHNWQAGARHGIHTNGRQETMRQATSRLLLIVIFGLAASCKPAPVAEWVVFESMPDATIYIDPSTIQRDGDRAEMWALIDYKQPLPDKTGKQVLSDKLHYQYDCQRKQLSIIETSAHAGPMASGEIINVNPDPPEVTPVPPDTMAEKMWKHACGDGAT